MTQNALIPLNDLQFMARNMASSGLFGVKNEVQALSIMLIAQAEGMHPAIAARDYDIVNGRPAKKTEAMLRDFLSNQGKVEWHELTDEKADATFSHPGGGTVRISWDMERAKAAGLGGKDIWKKYPRQMLRSRIISEGIRTVCPMATSGMYVPEEVQDFSPVNNTAFVKDMGKANTVENESSAQPQLPSLSEEELRSANMRIFTDAVIKKLKDFPSMDDINAYLTSKMEKINLLPEDMKEEIQAIVTAREA